MCLSPTAQSHSDIFALHAHAHAHCIYNPYTELLSTNTNITLSRIELVSVHATSDSDFL
jgi:hypothetical protein